MKATKFLYIGLSVLLLNLTACDLQPADTAEPVAPVEQEEKQEEKKEEQKQEEEKKEETKQEETKKEEAKKEEEQKKSEEQTKQEEQKKTEESKQENNFTVTCASGDTTTFTISEDKKTITLKDTKSGTQVADAYTITGTFTGQIINEFEDNEIILSGATLSNTNAPVILCNKKTYITAKSNTENRITANGTSETKYGAIHCEKSLELGGKGTCYITGNICHGIKATDVELKGSGTYYIQGTSEGSAINCKNFEAKEGKTFTVNLSKAKNGIKADETISIASGTFNFSELTTALKTDSAAKDGETPKNHSITLTAGTFNYNSANVTTWTATDPGKYTKTPAVIINEQ